MATPYYTQADIPAERFLLAAEGKDARYAPISVKRRHLDIYRHATRRNTEHMETEALDVVDPRAVDPLGAAEAADILAQAYHACTTTQRLVLRSYAENMTSVHGGGTHQAVAEALGMAYGTVQAHLHAIRTKVRAASAISMRRNTYERGAALEPSRGVEPR